MKSVSENYGKFSKNVIIIIIGCRFFLYFNKVYFCRTVRQYSMHMLIPSLPNNVDYLQSIICVVSVSYCVIYGNFIQRHRNGDLIFLKYHYMISNTTDFCYSFDGEIN